jgi:hypothetical protein
MTFDEVKRQSTLRLKEPRLMGNGTRMSVEGATFDFRLPNSRVAFPRSRYYWLEAGTPGDPHLTVLNIGITPEKLSQPALAAFHQRLQSELAADGWLPGHFVAKSEKTRQLWGGKNTTGHGRYWARGNTLLIFETKRMDEEIRGEPPGSGEFILTLAIRPRAHEPELVFGSQTENGVGNPPPRLSH